MPQAVTTRTDAELLAAYAAGDAGGFEELVRRHGAMVHRTCLRVLGRSDLAEEAAQAALLVLASRARQVGGSVPAFLHGAALNVARRQRAAERARRAREKEAAEMIASRRSDGRADWEDLRPHLDAALERLPQGERAAVLLHYLEGKPRADVARELGQPEGTVAWRLARALGRMRGFLRRRGVRLSAAGIGTVMAAGAGGGAACPAYLLAAAGKLAAAGGAGAAGGGAGTAAIGAGVAALAKGAIEAMFWMKVKLAVAALAAAAAVTAAVPVTVHAVGAAEETGKREAAARQPAAEPAGAGGQAVAPAADPPKEGKAPAPAEGTGAPERAGEPVALRPLLKDGKWGYVDSRGKMVIRPQYRRAWEFSEGLAMVIPEADGEDGRPKVGYIDRDGRTVIPPKFDNGCGFSDGLACVNVGGQLYIDGNFIGHGWNGKGKWGFIDTKGKVVVEPQFHKPAKFSGGRALVALMERVGKPGIRLIDRQGRSLKEFPGCALSSDLADGLAVFMNRSGRFGYIDSRGEIAIPPRFRHARPFSEGFAAVEVAGGRWAYIDKSGQVAVPGRFVWAYEFSEGLARVHGEGKLGFINAKGDFVIDLTGNNDGISTDYAGDFHEGLARVVVGGKTVMVDRGRVSYGQHVPGQWGYVDREGGMAIKPQFRQAGDFSGGLAPVNDFTSYVDRNGRKIAE
jgi:RNA polymerase sigma factor (sigma-70 family)